MEAKHSDKNVLVNGLKKMGLSLICMFLGPTLVYISPGLEDPTKKYAALILGIFICVGAISFGFMGIRTILKSIF